MATRNPYIFTIITVAFSLLAISSCAQNQSKKEMKEQKEPLKGNVHIAQNKAEQVTCKLTSPELQKRKQTVIASLKKQMLERKELPNGYAFKFTGADDILDMLTEFIKTERACCNFFIFTVSVSGDKSEAWLSLTGAEGTKEFITAELEL